MENYFSLTDYSTYCRIIMHDFANKLLWIKLDKEFIINYLISSLEEYDKEKIVNEAEKIVYEQLEFDEDDWETRTQKVQDLIASCLEKNAENRIKIMEIINNCTY